MQNEEIILALAREHDSFYLYDERVIRENAARLRTSFPQVRFLYSLKCNPHPQILRCVFGQGFGADAASVGEVRLARGAGLSPDRIYFSSPGKTAADIENSLDNCVLIADSLDEIGRIQTAAEKFQKTVRVGLRIHPAFDTAPSKFGIDEEEALSFLRENSCERVKISGIHVHLRSQILDAEVLSDYYGKLLSLAERVSALTGSLDFVNMGSGIGIPYAPADTALDLPALGAAVAERFAAFKAAHPETELIIEVGRYAAGKSGLYVTRVADRKVSRGKTFLIAKNTLNGFVRPSLAMLVRRYAGDAEPAGCEPLFTAKDAFEILTLKRDAPTETVTVAGNLCTAADVIAEDITLPRLESGDLLVLTNAGAYAASLTPFQFSSQERPAEFFLTERGEILRN